MYIGPYDDIQYFTSIELQIEKLTQTINDQLPNLAIALCEIRKIDSTLEVMQLKIASSYSEIVVQLQKIKQDIQQNRDELNDDTIEYLHSLEWDVAKEFNVYGKRLLWLKCELKLRHDNLLAKLDNKNLILEQKKVIYENLSRTMQVYVDWAEKFPHDSNSLDFTFIFKEFIALWNGMHSGEYTFEMQFIKNLYQDRFVGKRTRLAKQYAEIEKQVLSNSVSKLNLPNAYDELIEITRLYRKVNKFIIGKWKWPLNSGDLGKNYVAMQKFWRNVKNGKQSIQEWEKVNDDVELQKHEDYLRYFFGFKKHYIGLKNNYDKLYKDMLESLKGYCAYFKELPKHLQRNVEDKVLIIKLQLEILRVFDQNTLHNSLSKLHQFSEESFKLYNELKIIVNSQAGSNFIFSKAIVFLKGLFFKRQAVDNELVYNFIVMLEKYIDFAESAKLPDIFKLPYDKEDYLPLFKSLRNYLKTVVKGDCQLKWCNLEMYGVLHEHNAQSDELCKTLVRYHNQQVELNSIYCAKNDSQLTRYFIPFVFKPVVTYLFSKILLTRNYLYRDFWIISTGIFGMLNSIGLNFRTYYLFCSARNNTSQQVLFELTKKLQINNNVEDQTQTFKKICRENDIELQVVRHPICRYGMLTVDMLELLFYLVAPMPVFWANKIVVCCVVGKCRDVGYSLSKYYAKITFFSDTENVQSDIIKRNDILHLDF